MTTSAAPFSAFIGSRHLCSGIQSEVAIAVKHAAARDEAASILIIDNATGRPVDFDLRGTDAEIVARLTPAPKASEADEPTPAPAGRGRPKLGVVAREVTLLPRHWDWLGSQRGGASVALRRLVDEARKAHAETDRSRAARDAAYTFMSTIAGHLHGFEEASRALFANDRDRFSKLIAAWPDDIQTHIFRLIDLPAN